MSCGHRSHHHGGFCDSGRTRYHHACPCCCGTPSHGARRFWTKEERIARLEGYLEDLENEAQAVREQITEMTGDG